MVMRVAPYGVFCLTARTFANIGFDAFIPMLKYMLGVFIALGVQCFVVYMLLLKVFTGLNPIKFIKKFAPVMGFAFSTSSSNSTIPLSIEIIIYYTIRCNYKYGWNSYNARCCSNICCTSFWN